MFKALWSRVSVWHWRWCVAIGVTFLGALAAMGLVRRRDRESDEQRDKRRLRDEALVRQAIEQNRAEAEASRARARKQAEDAEWRSRRAAAEAQRIRGLPPTEREAELRKIRERLRKGSRAIVLLGLLLTANNVRAAEPMEHPTTMVAGWWMDDAEHAETAAWLTELADLRDAYSSLKASTAAFEEAARHDETQVAISVSLAKACSAQLELAQAEREVLQEEASRWYRRPAVTLGVGFGVGAALVTAIVLGAR